MGLTSSAGPFYARDSVGTLQKIRVVDLPNGIGTEDDQIAGYAYVEATGSTYEYISGALEKLSDISASISNISITADLGNLDDVLLNTYNVLTGISSSIISASFTSSIDKVSEILTSSLQTLNDISSSFVISNDYFNSSLEKLSSISSSANDIFINIGNLDGTLLNSLDVLNAISSSVSSSAKYISSSLGKIDTSNSELQDIASSLKNPLVVTTTPYLATTITKKRISNFDYSTKYKIINWNSENSGSFRLSQRDNSRKNLIIYNDSEKDLFISVADDLNPKIIVDFTNKSDLSNILLTYSYETGSTTQTLFQFNLDDIKNVYKYYSFTQEPFNIYGTGKECYVNETTGATLCISLTPEYLSHQLNKYTNINGTGSFYVTINNEILPYVRFDIPNTIEYSNKGYRIYTKFNGTSFDDSSLEIYDATSNRNGFDLSVASLNISGNAPEDYSYILYAKEAMSVDGVESTYSMFGYLLSPSPEEEIQEVTVRTVEAR